MSINIIQPKCLFGSFGDPLSTRCQALEFLDTSSSLHYINHHHDRLEQKCVTATTSNILLTAAAAIYESWLAYTKLKHILAPVIGDDNRYSAIRRKIAVLVPALPLLRGVQEP